MPFLSKHLTNVVFPENNNKIKQDNLLTIIADTLGDSRYKEMSIDYIIRFCYDAFGKTPIYTNDQLRGSSLLQLVYDERAPEIKSIIQMLDFPAMSISQRKDILKSFLSKDLNLSDISLN